MVLHYAVVLYTRLAPYREYYLHLSYANFYVKARKIYKFFEDGCRGILKASTGQVCSFGTGPKSFLEAPTASLKTLCEKGKGLRRAKVSFWQSPLPLQNFRCERGKAPFLFSYKIFMYMCYVKKVFSICIVNI